MESNVFIHDRFTFDVNGFCATYSYKGQTTTLNLCHGALCELLKAAKQIEDFTIDQNGEPVVVWTDNRLPSPYSFGFEHFCDFVRTFPMTYKLAVKLLEFKVSRQEHLAFQAKVIDLLSPIQAA